LGLTTFSAK